MLLLKRSPRRGLDGTVVERAAERDLRPDELEWVERIEHRRTALEDSADAVELDLSPEDLSFWTKRVKAQSEPGLELNGTTLTRRVASLTKSTSKSREWGEFLLKLTRDLGPTCVVELGSSVGLSAAYQAAGLKLAGHGKLVTIEGEPPVAAIARQTLGELDLPGEVAVGLFDDVLPGVLADGVTLAFVDGNHLEAPTLRYHAMIWDVLDPGGVAVYDDIGYSAGMKKAWKQISRSVSQAASLGEVGVVIKDDEL